jgi:hypothetical protein
MGWQAYAAYAAWGAGAWLIVWRLDPPWLLGWAVTIVLLLGWNAAEAYVRFALWLWWHPARCQGGGVAAPVPEAAS